LVAGIGIVSSLIFYDILKGRMYNSLNRTDKNDEKID
jgi:hypothetical protein